MDGEVTFLVMSFTHRLESSLLKLRHVSLEVIDLERDADSPALAGF
jgi:hypothetical protein